MTNASQIYKPFSFLTPTPNGGLLIMFAIIRLNEGGFIKRTLLLPANITALCCVAVHIDSSKDLDEKYMISNSFLIRVS